MEPIPQVSFLLTAYNFGKYIQTAINSLLAQRGGYDFEIIVVDDCSSDNTPELVRQIDDSRVHFVQHEKNLGVAGSINHAFSLARGQYICRFDGDDEWYPWLLEETIPSLEQNPDIGMVYGDISMINSKGEITVEKCGTRDISGMDQKSLLKTLLLHYFIPAPAIVARREAWQDALPLDDDLIFCDFDLSLKILSRWKLAYIPRALAKYRVHDGNIHTTSFTKQRRGENSIMKSVFSVLENTDILTKAEKKESLRAIYLSFGENYFGLGSMKDARRCYHKGLKIAHFARQKAYWRHYFASYISPEAYSKSKAIVKKILNKQSSNELASQT
ncbi:MAG: glycosyltransferase [Lewinellaceae bacterium]|nr:glycosyltransferase [Saprospiraceae bacterium]MCB9338340.1 glycosyltransferase [Lewinellaceae bacterium]